MNIPGKIREMLESWLTRECGVDATVGVDIHRLRLNEVVLPHTIEMDVRAHISIALAPFDDEEYDEVKVEEPQSAQSKS